MSCLFNSISHFIQDSNSSEVRAKICDYLKANKPLIDGIETKDILEFEGSNYISKMRGSGTWGGGIEIQSACNIWKLRIIIINRRDNSKSIEFLPVSGNYKRSIELEWTGGHYEPVRETRHVEYKRIIKIKTKRDKIKIIVISK